MQIITKILLTRCAICSIITNDMIDVNSPESEKMKWYYDVLNPKVHKIVDNINNNKKLWYEV